jgi:hypothetical protein
MHTAAGVHRKSNSSVLCHAAVPIVQGKPRLAMIEDSPQTDEIVRASQNER